jgi:hypothetical protein
MRGQLLSFYPTHCLPSLTILRYNLYNKFQYFLHMKSPLCIWVVAQQSRCSIPKHTLPHMAVIIMIGGKYVENHTPTLLNFYAHISLANTSHVATPNFKRAGKDSSLRTRKQWRTFNSQRETSFCVLIAPPKNGTSLISRFPQHVPVPSTW